MNTVIHNIKTYRPSIDSNIFALIVVVWIVLFYNQSFWGNLVESNAISSVSGYLFVASVFLFLTALFVGFLILFNFPYLIKGVAITLILVTSLASYYSQEYGVFFDKVMIQNIIETDSHESLELLNGKLVLHFILWGLLPSLIIWRINIRHSLLLRGLISKLAIVFLSAIVASSSVYAFYDKYASTARNHRELRLQLAPSNYIYALTRYVQETAFPKSTEFRKIGLDAKTILNTQSNGKKDLVILVIGETARAESFSLNGYTRQTNPMLSQEDIINFSNVSACGTATAVSLPCMFSLLTRDNYDAQVAKSQDSLLDVVTNAGSYVLWRDNNSGCKGNCDRIETQNMANLQHPDYCNDKECFDMILLDQLDTQLEKISHTGLIVLHQKGSHGPSYYHRYPESFQAFTPVCTTSDLSKCTQQEIINAYDNTILYTDYFLSHVIQFLKRHEDQFNTAMLYVSDHGESLGENNVYLHGLPYMIAPSQQTHVPMIAWLSPGFQKDNNLNDSCFDSNAKRDYSHDNLFDSVLGLLSISSQVYDKNLDIFEPCRNNTQTKYVENSKQ